MSLQTFTLEYRVPGALDGDTVSEAFEPGSVTDPEQIFSFSPAQLGLVDLTFQGQRSPRANRYAHWFFLSNYVADVGDVVASVARLQDPTDPSSPVIDVQPLIVQAAAADNIIYSRKCFFIPQGYLLRLRTNGRADESQPTLVRIGVYPPETQLEEVLIRRAKCCTQGIPDQTFETCIPPNLISFTPGLVNLTGDPEQSFNLDITGENFTSGVRVALTRVDPDDGFTVEASNVIFENESTIQAEFIANDFGASLTGTWTVSVFAATDPSCSGSLGGFQTQLV